MNHSFFFRHNVQNGKLISSVAVEELIKTDLDIFLVMILLESESDLNWYWLQDAKPDLDSSNDLNILDKNRVSYYYWSYLNRLTQDANFQDVKHDNSVHFAKSGNDLCTRCVVEESYLRAFELLRCSKVYSGNISISDFVTIVMSTERMYIDRNCLIQNYLKTSQNTPDTRRIAYKKYPAIEFPTMDIRIKYWDLLSTDMHDVFSSRYKKIISYVRDPSLLDGIKWI